MRASLSYIVPAPSMRMATRVLPPQHQTCAGPQHPSTGLHGSSRPSTGLRVPLNRSMQLRWQLTYQSCRRKCNQALQELIVVPDDARLHAVADKVCYPLPLCLFILTLLRLLLHLLLCQALLLPGLLR